MLLKIFDKKGYLVGQIESSFVPSVGDYVCFYGKDGMPPNKKKVVERTLNLINSSIELEVDYQS